MFKDVRWAIQWIDLCSGPLRFEPITYGAVEDLTIQQFCAYSYVKNCAPCFLYNYMFCPRPINYRAEVY